MGWMRDAGFSDLRVEPLTGAHSVMVGSSDLACKGRTPPTSATPDTRCCRPSPCATSILDLVRVDRVRIVGEHYEIGELAGEIEPLIASSCEA
jgi:hypothetical protein